MSSVLDRAALEESPLADLHLIANQLGIDGFRRLRKADLIDALVARQAGEEYAAPAEEEKPKPRARRSRAKAEPAEAESAEAETAAAEVAAEEAAVVDEDEETVPRRRSRGGRGRGRGSRDGGDDAGPGPGPGPGEERAVEGVVELLPNGSGFVRLASPETTDDDVYVSAAQVKRCELVSGDRVSGPYRPPRRSERFPSLVRVDTINGKPADEVAEGTRFDELPVTFPTERLELGAEDPNVQAIEWLTPFGKGSRVTITGGARSGKSDVLRRIAGALAPRDGVELAIVLAGVRPEEVSEWGEGIKPAAAVTYGAAPEAQSHAIEQVVEQGRRVAARGGDAIVIIDSLDYVSAPAARRALAAARNIVDGGSLTVIAAAPAALGGETTVITLNTTLTDLRRFPALDLAASGTMRPELLVGDAGAEAIARARAETLGG